MQGHVSLMVLCDTPWHSVTFSTFSSFCVQIQLQFSACVSCMLLFSVLVFLCTVLYHASSGFRLHLCHYRTTIRGVFFFFVALVPEVPCCVLLIALIKFPMFFFVLFFLFLRPYAFFLLHTGHGPYCLSPVRT